ncbi:MAG: hypothetical protein A3F72_13015 [Bacteroidetes bacterium RIFCSPLOWO2_12_FULL_35_15]|nr:MAG: hypothetical protein A3F72_13015 [Bacteroidetes bacterium RIFCSPLOWO2_12_FULL_35_15]
MKSILTVFFIIFNVIAYGQSFNVTTDTFDISLKELIKPATKVDLTHAIKFQNKYYCFFEERKKDNSRQDLKFCFIVSNYAKTIQKIKVPNEIQNTVYYDLFLRHDTIFVKTYMDGETYYFNIDKLAWVTIKDADDMIFEDERYYFTYLDFGEWGSTTWCKDKLTGNEYELASSGTIINKIDSVYYITAGLKILKIENPLKLKQCKNGYFYETVRQKKFSEGTNSLAGAEVLFDDTTYSEFEQKEPKLIVATSFVADNKLFHLCMDSTQTFIAKLENGHMTPIQIIGKNISTFDWTYSDRNKVQKDSSQLLKFKTKNLFGLIEIKGQEINIHYLHFK